MEQNSILKNKKSVSLVGLMRLFIMHKWVIMLSTCVCLIIGGIYLFLATPKYSSSVEVLIRQNGMPPTYILNALKARSNLGQYSMDSNVGMEVSEIAGGFRIRVITDNPDKSRVLCEAVLENYKKTEEAIYREQFENGMRDVIREKEVLLEDGSDSVVQFAGARIFGNKPVVQVMKAPSLEKEPVSPNKKSVLTISAAIGLLMGCTVVLTKHVNWSDK